MHKSNLVERLSCAIDNTKHEYQCYIDDGFDISASDSFSAQKNNHGDDIIGIISIEYYEPSIDRKVQTICEMAINESQSVYHEIYVGIIDKDCTEFSYVGKGFAEWAGTLFGWYGTIKRQPLSSLQGKIDAVQRHALPAMNIIASTINNHLNQQALPCPDI